MALLDEMPLSFPSRNRFFYNPAIPDRQLWAIGMVATQWALTEWLLDSETQKFTSGDPELIEKQKALRSLRERLNFFEELVEQNSPEPLRSNAAVFVGRIRDLSARRNDILHRMWGGGMPDDISWNNPDGFPESDAVMMRQTGDKFKKSKDESRSTIHWRLTFNEIRKIAVAISTLNRDFMMLFIVGPNTE